MTTEKPFRDQPSNLNLLLKQQIIRQLEEANEDHYKRPNYEDCVTIDKKTTISKKIYSSESDFEGLRMTLANTQINESTAAENHKLMCDHYDLLEQVLEHVVQYVECIILESKSMNRLSIALNAFAISDNLITGDATQHFNTLCESPNLATLEEVRTKLFVCLNSNENINSLRYECEEKKRDFHLALKNFKIILEVMNINNSSLKKLQHQFEEVLMKYQECRCVLDKELPYVIAERSKVLSECLGLLGQDMETRLEDKLHFSNQIKKLKTSIDGDGYALVKKEDNV
ncbi:unnamed protein product [Brassicogethes aeneus]|uniref:Uncharacterized protein n=1 Tax=Brassicogethes aeneus TaxID=1431903 RepID=A0A9P0AUW0_BRAAE|nr:unnamed protein product [Brassicogethes aeneus]